MIREVARQLRPLLDRPRTDLLVIAVVSAVAGVAEATVLVLIVNAAVAIAEGLAAAPIDLPVIGVEASVGAVLWTAAILGIGVALMNASVAWLSARTGTAVLRAARHRSIAAFLGASWSRQSAEREGSVQETATTLSFNCSSLTMILIRGIAAGIALAAMLATALLVDVLVTAVVVAFGAMLFLLFRPVARLTRRRATAFVGANSRFSEDVARMAAMSMEYRVFGVDRQVLRTLDDANADVSEKLRRSRFAAQIGATSYRDAAVLFLVAAVAALNAGDGDRLVEVGAVALLIVRGLGYATATQSALQQVNELAPNLALLNDRLERLEADRDTAGSVPADSFDSVELRGVSYTYDERAPALREVDLTIRQGEVLGIVGPSGSGKSTLLQILLRLRAPIDGTVRIDDLDYERIAPESWSRLVAMVPQEPQLMEASVAENIAFLRPGIDRAGVEAAADAAHVGTEIRALPNGFDTVLGPRGSGLSGGQKQRIAFARALAGQPRLLVLDEPTSALDGDSERRIQETIDELKGRVTMVIVAHRLSTLDVCDRVISMRGGRIEATESTS